MDRYLASDFFNHVTGRFGTEDFKRLAAELRSTPEKSSVIEFMIAEGDLVAAYMTIRRIARQGATLFGHKVKGIDRSYTVHHVHIYRLVNGKITEHWALRDDISLLQQLGLVDPTRTEP